MAVLERRVRRAAPVTDACAACCNMLKEGLRLRQRKMREVRGAAGGGVGQVVGWAQGQGWRVWA